MYKITFFIMLIFATSCSYSRTQGEELSRISFNSKLYIDIIDEIFQKSKYLLYTKKDSTFSRYDRNLLFVDSLERNEIFSNILNDTSIIAIDMYFFKPKNAFILKTDFDIKDFKYWKKDITNEILTEDEDLINIGYISELTIIKTDILNPKKIRRAILI